MRPREFLELATQLAEGSRPAEHRSAISRAYYAVFNSGEEFFERMGLRRVKGDYHVILQRRLLNSADTELTRVGSRLSSLHAKRVLADYKLADKTVETGESARAAVQRATEMIDVLDNCAIYSDRWKNMKAAIQRVEKV